MRLAEAQVDNVPDALMAAQQNTKANNCQSLKLNLALTMADLDVSENRGGKHV